MLRKIEKSEPAVGGGRCYGVCTGNTAGSGVALPLDGLCSHLESALLALSILSKEILTVNLLLALVDLVEA
jgi:hypothetical protein